MTPLVSIVVNNYNNAKFLPECLDSLIRQTYQNIEIIVVDALSTDNSREIVASYAAKDPRIKPVYCTTYTPYPAITYNIGFLNCSGEYIAINDADDTSLPGRIEAQAYYLRYHSTVDVVGCNCYEFTDRENVLVKTTVERNVANANPPVRNPCLMFRKKVLAVHGPMYWESEYAADFEWLYRWYAGGVKFHILEAPHVRYRKAHGTNVSVKKVVNQAAKLAWFRTAFGVKMFGRVGLKWWLVTLKTYAFLFANLILPKVILAKIVRTRVK